MNRRQWLTTAAGAALAARFSWAKEASSIKITGLDIFTAAVGPRPWTIFRLSTNEGLTGLGDATHADREPKQASALARNLFEVIKGRGIFEIERLRQAALAPVFAANRQEKRLHAVAFAGLEQCLWDLQGKALGVPCHQLFGGKLHEKIRNYANINRSTRGEDRTPEGFAASARRAADAGFDAFKLAAFDHLKLEEAGSDKYEKDTQFGIDCLNTVREAIGPDRDMLVDGHSHFDRKHGVELTKRLAHLNLFWLEEVCRNTADLAAINSAAPMPTAGGESLFGVKEFLPYISAGAVDIVMPDVKFCGGMYELKKIAALAEAAGMKTSPHGPASPIGNMAAAHVCASMPNFQILEFSYGEVPWRAEFVNPPEIVEHGRLKVLDRPGIGYELNEKIAKKYGG